MKSLVAVMIVSLRPLKTVGAWLASDGVRETASLARARRSPAPAEDQSVGTIVSRWKS